MSLLRETPPLLVVGRQRRAWSMGKGTVVTLMTPGCAHLPVPVVRFALLVTWRLCAAGQLGPVVQMCAGKARRNLAFAVPMWTRGKPTQPR
jgi:hypothetical protein